MVKLPESETKSPKLMLRFEKPSFHEFATTFTTIGWPATVIVSLTLRLAVVLISSVTFAPACTGSEPPVTLNWPLSVPATPSEKMIRPPWPPVSETLPTPLIVKSDVDVRGSRSG